MRYLVAALVMAAFSAVSLAQGTAPAPSTVTAVSTSSQTPATNGTKKTKKKKAKKSTGAPKASAPTPTK